MRISPAVFTAVLLLTSTLAAAPQAYLDVQSAAPGDTVTVHTSIASPTYSVKVLRSFGFGSSVEMLSSGALAGATQTSPRGSYAWTPTAPALEIIGGLSLEAWIYPTHRNGTNAYGILSKYSEPNDAAYNLYLLPDGRVSFYLGSTGQFDPLNRLISTTPVPLRQWTHVVGTFNGDTKRIYINARIDVSQSWTGPIFKTGEPVRVGAYGSAGKAAAFFNGMVDSPAIYERALFAGEIELRNAQRANYGPANPGVLPLTIAQWNIDESEGEILRDVTNHGFDLQVVNYGTRGVAGPSPRNQTQKSHSIRFAEDDLFNPKWAQSWSFTVPASWGSGFYIVEVQEGVSHKLPLVIKPQPTARAEIAVLAATNTWNAYNGWGGNLYSTHVDGTIRYYVGLQQPNPGAYADLQSPGTGYSHLTDAERYLWQWLSQNGYPFDLYSDLDLHQDPTLLDTYKVLILNGHSEHWSHEMIDHVEAFQARGGNVVNLSGNTMWTLVTYSDDFTVMEGRTHPHSAGTIPASERWHSQAGGVLGGTLRCIGRPEHRVLGTGYGISLNTGSFGHYRVRMPRHWVFAGTDVFEGTPFGRSSLNGNAILGHQADLIVPEWSPSNIQVLATGFFAPASELLTFNCQTRTTRTQTRGSEMIYFDHAGGGGVFGAPTIAFGGSLVVDPIASRALRNVLDRFTQ